MPLIPPDTDFVVIDLLQELTQLTAIEVPLGGGKDEFEAISGYMGGVALNELAVWVSVTVGPILMSQPLLSFALKDEVHFHYKDILTSFPEWRRRKWMPIASDGCGNYYLYPMTDEFGKYRPIFFVDVMKDRLRPAYAVASHLFHFLIRLIEAELNEEEMPFEREKVLKQDIKIQQIAAMPLPW